MSGELPEWLKAELAADVAIAPVAQRHLSILRGLLARDYLARADWRFALRDLAAMAQRALEADRALVGVYEATSGSWSVTTSDGEDLAGEAISKRASLSVLEAVRHREEPVLGTGSDPLPVESPSLSRQGVDSILAVPIHWWDVRADRPRRAFGGCLYAHRTADRPPFDADDVALVIDITRIAEPLLNVLRDLRRLETALEVSRRQLEELRHAAAEQVRLGAYVSYDPWFGEHVLMPLRRVASAQKVSILIMGPTGSGKTYLAESFHYECARREGPFVTLDCAQVTSSETLSAELFGFAPDSGYANAPRQGRIGKAELADGGTLFIDEVSTLPADLQQRLLRLLDSGLYTPLGSGVERRVDIQVIAATNEDLPALVAQGRFREDLFWRLAEVVLRLPPLSDRVADIPHLAKHFLAQAKERYSRRDIEGFDSDAMARLQTYDWSRAGNMRGLAHAISRSVLMAPPGTTQLSADLLTLRSDFDNRPMRPASTGDARYGGLALDPPPPATSELVELLRAKIEEHRGQLVRIGADPEVLRALGYEDRRVVPNSSLWVKIRELGLLEELEAARRLDRQLQGRAEIELDVLVEAIRHHGSGARAAAALGITRDALVWQLRKRGLTIRGVLSTTGSAGGG